MTLRVIVGKANTGKTGILHRAVEDTVSHGRKGVLVLPSRPDVSRASEEFAGRAPVGAEISTFDDWLEGLWAAHGDGRRLVSATARSAVARLVGARASGRLSGLAASRGLAVLVAGVAERTAGQGVSAGRPAASSEIAEIGRLVGEYRDELLGLGLVEPGEAAALLAANSPLTGATVAFNRFTDLSAGQEALVEGLSAANDVLVGLTWEEGLAPTEALNDLVDRLRRAGAEVETVGSGGASSEIDELADGLFSDRPALEPNGGVVLMEAAGAEAEAALVAGAVRELLDEGFSAEQVAVVFRDPFARLGLLERAFAAEGVNLAADIAMPFARTPLGRALLSLMAVALGSGGRADLVAFLSSPYSGVPASVVHEADANWRRKRVADPFRLLTAAAELSPDVRPIVTLARACASDGAGSEAGNWQELGSACIANAWGLSDRSRLDHRLDARAFDCLVSGAVELAEVGASGGRAVADSLRGVRVSTGLGEVPGAVTLTEAHRLRSRRFDALVIGGLTAAEFSSERPEPLIADVLRGLGYPAGVDERLSERHLFYTLVSRARTKLVLVRQAQNASGQLIRASSFWDEVVDRYRTPAEVLEERPSRLQVDRTLPLSRLIEAAPVFSAGRRAERESRAHSGVRPRARASGRVDGALLLEGRDEFSVTDIEAYIRCPQGWFRDRVLRPGRLDAEFGARETGTFVHALLAEFYLRFTQAGCVRVTPDNVETALEMFEATASEALTREGWKAEGLAEKLALGAAVRQARGVVEADALLLEGFAPSEFEWRFGAAEGRPFELGGVSLRGSIDRVDRGNRGVVVTDYKTSETFGADAFESKGVLQPVVYAMAAAAHLGGEIVGGVYRSISSGKIRGFWDAERGGWQEWLHAKDAIDEDRVEELRAYAAARIAAAVAGMRAGEVPASPLNSSACSHCSAAPACDRGAHE